MKTLIVINNYSRPQSIPIIIKAWLGQGLDVHIVIVDNRPMEKGPFVPYGPVLYGTDDVWRITDNLGCPCKLYPALALYQYKYAVLCDDDFIPGPNALQHLLATAIELSDRFSTIGQIGRMIQVDNPSGQRYSGRYTPQRWPNRPTRTDLVCRVQLVQTAHMAYAFALRANILARNLPDAPRLCGIHDDMLTSFGIQMGTGFPSYLIPQNGEKSELIDIDLDDKDDKKSLWKRPNHFPERNAMVDLCIDAGWRRIT